jgi:hypothetical protein
MKNFLFFLAIGILFTIQAQTIKPAPVDKAVVYFVRATGYGGAVNFTYFDSSAVIGRFNGSKFIRDECTPGVHLFWARAENRDYVSAKLEAGKIYVIDVIPVMGAFSSGVKLVPINSTQYSIKKIQKNYFKKRNCKI